MFKIEKISKIEHLEADRDNPHLNFKPFLGGNKNKCSSFGEKVISQSFLKLGTGFNPFDYKTVLSF